ncbi:hypothetical protein TEA_001261 [Camellia sinensis var. sinensis]|uniref:Disease resistance RPP13-like protein 1 n=2 Tax=Camellia sinensis TaxID=4442 RepID=A0A4S4ECP1_CAMSN|nr:hypothetical protein TEA_001261 [Camellia sinensis var. sinensis]
MAIGELLIAASIKFLFQKLATLASGELSNFERGFGGERRIRTLLTKWSRTLEEIEAVLVDVDEKQVTERGIKIWLEDLQDLAYDVDDILEEFSTEALRPKSMITTKVRALIPTKIVKLDEITTRFQDLLERRTVLGLQKVGSRSNAGTSAKAWQRPPTTCLMNEPSVYGRDEDKKKIIELLLLGGNNHRFGYELKSNRIEFSQIQESMAIGELLIAASIKFLFEKLATLAAGELSNFARGFGGERRIRTLLTKWSTTLEEIEAVLVDADEKQVTERGIKIWLEDLQDLAYDVDDILDEFSTEALRPKSMITTKVRALIPTKIVKLDEITTRFQDLLERRTVLGLQKVGSSSNAGTSAKAWQRPPTTCLMNEPSVYGRDEDKKKIIELLLLGVEESSNCNIGVVPIVGMGGVGKTTLAQMVYNDDMVGKHFEIKAWVCVSEDFDITQVTKAILDDWSSLKSPFNDGARGSKVMVTTRNTDVALMLGTAKCHHLKQLSMDDCWSVFAQDAFENTIMEASANLVSIGRKIVEKYGGLHLAARTLGGLLRCKLRDDEWEDVLNSKMWELSDQESDILPALGLSYHHLPSHLKKCFAYCSILPKNCRFTEMNLVLLWMSEGFIQQPKGKGKKQMEDLGHEYFHELLSRSFFQPSTIGESSKFVMHDLIIDLAQFVAGKICFRLEDKSKVN